MNTLFNLNNKYFLHLPRLLNVCKRLTVIKWFLPALQSSLPGSDLISDPATLQHSLLQLSSFTVTLGSLLAFSLNLVLFLNSSVSVSYSCNSSLGSFTGWKLPEGKCYMSGSISSCFFRPVSNKLTFLFQWLGSSLSLVIAKGIPCK